MIRSITTTVALILSLLFFSVGVANVESVNAHEFHNADGTSQNYTNWQRPDGKGSCCNLIDCRPVKCNLVHDKRGAVIGAVLEVGDRSVSVPPDVILHDQPVTDMNCHWCGYVGKERVTHYCFVYPKGDAKLEESAPARYAVLD